MEYYALKNEIQGNVMEQLDLHRDWTDEDILQVIDNVILNRSKEIYMSSVTKLTLRQELFNAIRRLDLLQELVDDKEITEIMVNGAGDIFFEKYGQIQRWDKSFESSQKLEDVIQQIVARANRHVNEASPIVDTGLSDGSRVNVVLKPVAINGPILTIRKFSEKPITMKQLIEWESISKEAAAFLEKLVIAGYNIVVSGGTGTGKTTLLNALTNYIPRDERIITIEDSAELQIQGIKNLVKLEARIANTEGDNAVSIRDLIKTSLRMRPDRIVVGEVRGAEAIDMLAAMNTGHDGSLSTGHANTPVDMISRLETMVLMGMDIPLAAIRSQISSSIDIIVQLGRLRDKSRRIVEITEVLGVEDGKIVLNPIYQFKESQKVKKCVREDGSYGRDSKRVIGKLESTGNMLKNTRKLEIAGMEI